VFAQKCPSNYWKVCVIASFPVVEALWYGSAGFGLLMHTHTDLAVAFALSVL